MNFHLSLLTLMLSLSSSLAFGVSLNSFNRVGYVVPTTMNIRLINGEADFSIERREEASIATIVFEPDYESAPVNEAYGDRRRLNLEFKSVDLSGAEAEGFKTKKMSFEYTTLSNQLNLQVYFPPALSDAEVLDLLNVSDIFGYVEARIRCTDDEDEAYCGAPVGTLALTNQFRMEKRPESWKVDKANLDRLKTFKRQLILDNHIATNDFEGLARSRLGSCRGLRDFETKVCKTIAEKSPTLSLNETIDVLSKAVYLKAPDSVERFKAGYLELQDFHLDGLCVSFEKYNIPSFVDNRITFGSYELTSIRNECTVADRGQNYVDIKFASDNHLIFQTEPYGLGMDAIFRATKFGCSVKFVNLEGNSYDYNYVQPPAQFFNCTGSHTDNTSCFISEKELKESSDRCDARVNSIMFPNPEVDGYF